MFKIGDRVRLIGEIRMQREGLVKGLIGTVIGRKPAGVMVVFDKASSRGTWLGKDRPDGHFLLKDDMFELADEFSVGDRVVYHGTLGGLDGKSGVISGFQKSTAAANIRFDHEPRRERVIYTKNLTRLENDMTNFKTTVQSTVTTLLKALVGDSPKEEAVRKLGVAAELVKLGEKAKNEAKKQLTAFGIIDGTEQSGVVFDSSRYVVTATTKAASSRLDAGSLTDAMNAEGLSQAMQRRIIAASTIQNKAATSFSVEVK